MSYPCVVNELLPTSVEDNIFTNFAALPSYIDYRAFWLSGNAANALASINLVALRQTRLVPGWVTVCGRVNHFCM